jgi:hypothetical protein
LAWLACGAGVVTAAVRARRHPDARRAGRIAMALLYIPAGALVNAVFIVRGDDYANFADGAYLAFVRHTWHTLVVPNHHWFIWALIAFEFAVGVLALVGGRATQLAYALVIAFHVGLMSFGFGFWLWALPMIAATAALLRAERATDGHAPARLRLRHAWAS